MRKAIRNPGYAQHVVYWKMCFVGQILVTLTYMTGFARCYFPTWTMVPLFIAHVFLLSMIFENIMKFEILSVIKQQPFFLCWEVGDSVFYRQSRILFTQCLISSVQGNRWDKKAPFCSFSHFQIKYVFNNKQGSKCFFGKANGFVHINLIHIYGFHCEFEADNV